MDKEKIGEKAQGKGLQTNRFYRCRPTMSEANIIGEYLVDLEGLNLQFFSIKDFNLVGRFPVISKEDQYCAQLRVISPKVLVIFGVDKFMLFNTQKMSIVETVKLNNYIEKFEISSEFIAILSSDDDSQNKVVNCWRIQKSQGKVVEKFKSTLFQPVEYEDCNEDNLCMSIILSIEGNPKIYVYWKETTCMIEADPCTQLSEKYNRHHPIYMVFDLSKETYAEIVDNSIYVMEKAGGKKLATLFSKDQVFTQVYSDGSKDKVYSLSNLGLKKWVLQVDATPALYLSSEKQKIKKVFLQEDGQVIGLNLDSNNVIIWKNPEEYSSFSFPNEVIRKVIKINEHQVFFLLEATANSEDENEYHVFKYNKLQVYDFDVDNEVAKKAMLKSQHSIDIDSAIMEDADTIRFIVNEKSQKQNENDKKYLLKWTPLKKDQTNKDTKKKQIKGLNNSDVIKVYPFNKILVITYPKSKAESFSLFNAKQQNKTQIIIYDFSMKKIGQYDLQGDIQNVQLGQKNQLFTICSKRLNIYSIASQNKNRLEKTNELDISAQSIHQIGSKYLIKKPDSFLMLNEQFECIMRQDIQEQDKTYKIMLINSDRFLLKTERRLMVWDTQDESVQNVQCPECEPSLMEYMDGKVVVADKWVQVYDLKVT